MILLSLEHSIPQLAIIAVGGLIFSTIYNVVIWIHEPAPVDKLLKPYCFFLSGFSIYFAGRFFLGDFGISEQNLYGSYAFTLLNEPIQISLYVILLNFVQHEANITSTEYPISCQWIKFTYAASGWYILFHLVWVCFYKQEDIQPHLAYLIRFILIIVIARCGWVSKMDEKLYLRYVRVGIFGLVIGFCCSYLIPLQTELGVVVPYNIHQIHILAISVAINVLFFSVAYGHQLRDHERMQFRESLEQREELINTKTVLQMQLEQKVEAAKDLHDNIGPTINHIKRTMTTFLKKDDWDPTVVKSTFAGIHQASYEILNDIGDLMGVLDSERKHNKMSMPDKQLLYRMKKIAEVLLQPCSIALDFQVSDGTQTISNQLNGSAHLHLIRIFKEAINNICKHSEATQMIVTFHIDQENLFMKIQDNGKGFSDDESDNGNGLYNMQVRTQKLQGAFSYESVENQGTTLYFSFKIDFLKT